MLPVRKNDTVTFADNGRGKVVGIITTAKLEVLKVKKLCDSQIVYVEAHMVHLEKQCARNYMLTIACEVAAFLVYILSRALKGEF